MPNKKKKKSKRNSENQPETTWSMYPALHDSVSALLEEEDLYYTFEESDHDGTCIRDYDTNVMGRFICHNKTCTSNGWSSKVVPITIRMYPGQRYNARVYHQRCRRCQTLSRPILDDSYAERISYRIKKWAGVEVEMPLYDKSSKGPHQSELCEGCKAGHCKALVFGSIGDYVVSSANPGRS